MNKWPLSDPASMNAFYGDPDKNRDGLPDPEFEAAKIIRITPPYPMVLAWNLQPLSRIAIHKECAESLLAALDAVGRAIPQKDREHFHLNRYGGGYMFRPIRGGSRLSIHSWGAAIDLAPELNGLGVPYKPPAPGSNSRMMPRTVIEIFARHGWRSGAGWSRPDAMHFQAARTR